MSTQSNTPQTSDIHSDVFQHLREGVRTSENMHDDKHQQARDKQRKKIMEAMAKQQAQLDALAKEEADENATKIKQYEKQLSTLQAYITNGESAIKRAKEEAEALVNGLRILKGKIKFKAHQRT